ncbi:hypothetical protein MPDQ_000260 [Monascus purpureus]|uniref:Peroxin 22-like n=1 Tax=Monascus purpureus TaxID=5098 RepID=A0A507QUI9_MONPU|nr:hypothetical protein MPDQ_000260 [Monascus purpureus]BDD57509.1 hypothetical protein MAP00_002864 [Monascus purpureus]
MSLSYPQDSRRRIGAGRGFSATGRRTVLGYWVPLALTVGIATIGVAAWIWSERNDDDDDDYPKDDDSGDERPPPPPGPGSISGGYPPVEPGAAFPTPGAPGFREISQPEDSGMFARMQGALRRTPSPQQIFDGASRKVAAGVAAAGAFVGLTPIREEGRGDFEDHTKWSEEVESRANERDQQAAIAPVMSGALSTQAATPLQPSLDKKKKKKKTVAIVVSSVSPQHDPDGFNTEHASILSHLPEHVDQDTSRVFVLIYAPELKHAISQGASSHPTLSVASSYSNIAREEAESGAESPSEGANELEGTTPFFKTLYTQAQSIVEKDTMILPFSTKAGHVHLIRHLSPDLVYIQESLTGNEGDLVHHMSGWVRQVVVVVGDEGGRGGLIDSEDESTLADKGEKWWQREGITGIGKRIDVVDVLRVGDDWRRRVQGHD